MKLRNYVCLLALATMSLGSLQATADTNTGIPTSLTKATGAGTVDSIYKGKRNEIVIGDIAFKMSPTLAVRSFAGQMLGGRKLLKKGQTIAYRVALSKEGGSIRKYLAEAWILPAKFKIPDEWK